MSTNVQSVQVVATCPNCGSEDHEFDIDPTRIAATHHLIQCEDCGRSVVVSVAVEVQSWVTP